jgi:phage tail sheath gpL-like
MAIDASVVARVLGISAEYEDLREGGADFLPQRVYVIAQGSSDAVYPPGKYLAGSAAEVGGRFGYGSPAHNAARMLLPANGDGVGTVPVTIFPLEDDGAGVAAAGHITPSGTQTKAGAYRAIVGGIRSEEFVINAGDDVTARVRKLGDAIAAVLHMPVKVDYTYGTVTSQAGTNTGNGTVTALSAPGNPKPGAWTLTLITVVADGGVFRVTDPDGVVVGNATMTPGAGGATVVNIGGLQFTLTDAATDFALNDSFTITVPATRVNLTAKWAGESGNDIYVTIEGEDLGTTWTIVQPTGGLVNPDVTPALEAIGNTWETMVLNCLNVEDEDALDAIQQAGEGRYGATVSKPFVAFVGNTAATVAEATAISSTRRDDRINAQLVSPGSNDLPFMVAARQLARIAAQANNNPPTDYGALRATLLTPGDDALQWDYLKRDQAVKLGSSTIEVNDGVVELADIVTFYRPEGEEPPPYRFVVDIVKVQNIIYNFRLEFAQPEWAGAPLVPDDQVTSNPNARQPRQAKARVFGLTDGLADRAVISDPAFTKRTADVRVDQSNPKRLNIAAKFKLAGNTNVKDVSLKFGFYFGTP